MTQATRPKPGDLVTVFPAERDPYILNFQRHCSVARVDGHGRYWLHVEASLPPRQEYGPIPAERLKAGWRDRNGRWL